MPGPELPDAEEVGDLADAEQQRRADHEAEDHGFGNVAGQVAKLEDGDEDLDGSDHHAKQHQGLGDLGLVVGIEKGERAEDDERDRAGRPVDQMRRRAEHRGDRRHDDRRVEPVARVDAGEQRIGHALRQRDRGDRQAGDRVGAQLGSRVVPADQPAEAAGGRFLRRGGEHGLAALTVSGDLRTNASPAAARCR